MKRGFIAGLLVIAAWQADAATNGGNVTVSVAEGVPLKFTDCLLTDSTHAKPKALVICKVENIGSEVVTAYNLEGEAKDEGRALPWEGPILKTRKIESGLEPGETFNGWVLMFPDLSRADPQKLKINVTISEAIGLNGPL